MSKSPPVFEKLRGLRDIEVATFFVIREIIHARRLPVCPDDPEIFTVLRSNPRRVREAILRLVKVGVLVTAEGYLGVQS